ncbi:MAG: caspase family protein [Bacteroidia bacterium]|nr:caspase family protein [Bacteroidia bacterium]
MNLLVGYYVNTTIPVVISFIRYTIMPKTPLNLFLIFFICPLFVFSQNRFTRFYGGPANEHAIKAIQSKDGDVVVAGITFSYGKGKSDVWVMKLDSYGEEIWRKYIGQEGFDFVSGIIETRDGNYTLAGYRKDKDNSNADAWVAQLNRYGEVMWEHTFGWEGSDEIKALIQTNDGGFALCGVTDSKGDGQGDVWLLRLNAVGDLLWDKAYGGKYNEKGLSIVEDQNDALVICGYGNYPESKSDMLVLKVDRNGKGIWKKILREKGVGVAECLTNTSDGGVLIAGRKESKNGNGLDGTILSLSASGGVRWEKNFGDSRLEGFVDLQPVSGGFVLIGQKERRQSRRDLWLMKVSESGDLIWERNPIASNKDWAHGVAVSRDGGLILAGGTKSYGNGGSDMLIMKTNRRGEPEPGSFDGGGEIVSRTENSDAPRESDPFKPNLYILSIGVSDYKFEDIDLRYAHADASSIGEKFSELEGSLYGQVKVKQLLNGDANLVNIKKGLSWLEREATQKDVILLFISAHGALDNKGNLFILPSDFQSSDLFATGLNISQITEGISGTPCKKLILLDACHSGQSGYDILETASVKALNVNQAVEELVGGQTGVTVMTSSSGNEFSYENSSWKHGAFTKGILEGLDGRADYNHDELISLLELNLYVTERVKELTRGQQHPYTPINLFGDIPLFIVE